MERSAKTEATELMNTLLPFAEEMLAEYGEFLPFGGAIMKDGSIADFGADNGTEHSSSQSLISLLESAFVEGARTGDYRATAVVCDVRVVLPNQTEKTDAIAVRLDHMSGYSVEVMIPYERVADGSYTFGEMFAQEGEHKIFASSSDKGT